jgi:hypothetical protein
VVFAQASGREEAKRIARQYLKHDPDRYIVEPLTRAEAEVHVSLRPPAVNGLVARPRAEVETLRGEVMARDGVIRDRDTENELLKAKVEALVRWIDTAGRECPSGSSIDALLAAASDEEKAT